MDLRFPAPLRPGDLVGVTAPSSGVPDHLWGRLEAGVRALRDKSYDVVVGDCIHAPGPVSAPKEERAEELTAMLTDPQIRVVVPPWGGELGTDLLDLLDWQAIAEAEPTWLVGFSDTSSIMAPLTLRTGWATLHGSNLMDTPYEPAPGLVHWTDVAASTTPITQTSPGGFRSGGWDDYQGNPEVSEMTLDAAGSWETLDGFDAELSGRLIGGCLETLTPLSGFLDVAGFGRDHAADGVIVYIDRCEWTTFDLCRALHGMRHAGWFDNANGVLLARSPVHDDTDFTEHEAALDALGDLGIPVVRHLECGHVQPFLPLVNGALAQVSMSAEGNTVTQEW